MDKFERIYYMEMADGEMMRVPESMLEEFHRLNEEIKAEMQQSEETSQENSSSEDKPKK